MRVPRSALMQLAQSRKVAPQVLSSPRGGWNLRDPLNAMPPTDATLLDNWFPDLSGVRVRDGFASHSTGMVGAVETLVEYHAGSIRKLIGAADGELWDVTTATASSLGSGYSNNRWQFVNFNGTLHGVNGEDAPISYNGSSISNPSWSGTGLTVANLSGVHVFKNRLFFWEDDSQDFWYAGINAITGTLTKFELSRVSQFGGNLVAMATWTFDGGDGVDDYAVFILSSGQVIVYRGDDPGDASSWALIGEYRIPNPVNKRAVLQWGGDILVTTSLDHMSLGEILKTGRGSDSKIAPAVSDAVGNYKDNFGWQSVAFLEGGQLIFNIPVSSTNFQQHVLNTQTGAWCRFTGINARCWASFDGALYFGGADRVYKVTGTTDAGANISCDGISAPSRMGYAGRKRIAAIRPMIESAGGQQMQIGLGFDFNSAGTSSMETQATSDGTTWDNWEWGDPWNTSESVDTSWRAAAGTGFTVSTRLKTDASKLATWIGTEYQIEAGNSL